MLRGAIYPSNTTPSPPVQSHPPHPSDLLRLTQASAAAAGAHGGSRQLVAAAWRSELSQQNEGELLMVRWVVGGVVSALRGGWFTVAATAGRTLCVPGLCSTQLAAPYVVLQATHAPLDTLPPHIRNPQNTQGGASCRVRVCAVGARSRRLCGASGG